jgi:hypothetical protein
MAALTVNTAVSTGTTPAAAVQITAWSGTGDTITANEIGDRGVLALVSNTSGGSLDFRVEDPGTTAAGNAAANGYTTVTVPNSATRTVFIGKGNVNAANGTVKVGASTSNAAFTVAIHRY